MGVLVVMDDRIISARENRKLYPRTGGFSGGEMGDARRRRRRRPGVLLPPGAQARRGHGVRCRHASTRCRRWSWYFSYPGGDGPRLGDGTQGLVVATTGFSPSERDAFTDIRRKGVVMVQAFPSGEHVAGGNAGPPAARPAAGPQGGGPFAGQNQNLPPTVVVQHLLPQKARILLMLALTRTRDPREIQRIFNEYLMSRGSADLARLAAGIGAVAAVVAVYVQWLHVSNVATVSTTFLLIVLIVAATSRLWVAVITSAAAMLCFNYFFLPPAGTLTIADPQNWVALLAFIAVSLVASHLSTEARTRTEEALVRRDELARLFDLSRDVLVTTDSREAISTLARAIARRFDLEYVAIALPRANEWDVFEAGPMSITLDTRQLTASFATAQASLEFDARERTYAGHRTMETEGRTIRLVPLRVGTGPSGCCDLARADRARGRSRPCRESWPSPSNGRSCSRNARRPT